MQVKSLQSASNRLDFVHATVDLGFSQYHTFWNALLTKIFVDRHPSEMEFTLYSLYIGISIKKEMLQWNKHIVQKYDKFHICTYELGYSDKLNISILARIVT